MLLVGIALRDEPDVFRPDFRYQNVGLPDIVLFVMERRPFGIEDRHDLGKSDAAVIALEDDFHGNPPC